MKMSHKSRERLYGYSFISPWIIGFLIFGLFPIIYSLYLSLNDVTITAEGIKTSFVGFSNYIAAFTTKMSMIQALIEFLQSSLFMIVIINVFAVIFAVLLNSKIKFRGFFRTIFFLPVVVVSGPVMSELVDKGVITMTSIVDMGIIDIISQTLGSNVSDLITNTFTDLIYMFWFSGVQLIVYLAVLQKVDKSIYESAQMDGASVWESFWKITLPALKTVILINIVYTLILLATFDTNGVITVIKSAMFAVDGGYGFASALAWIYFIALAVIISIIMIIFVVSNKQKPVGGVRNVRIEYEYSLKRYEKSNSKLVNNKVVKKSKKILFGKNLSDGLLMKVFTYVLLGIMSFAFLYPFIYLILKSLQSPSDVVSSSVGLIPSSLYFDNFIKAYATIDFFNSLQQSIFYALIPTICQVVAASFVGYGLARFNFFGKKLVMGLIVMMFVIPPQILMIPTYILYNKLDILGSVLTFALPAILAQGIKSTIFILIFYQFFIMIPKELDEAAEIDGASRLKIFFQITIPLSVPILIVGFIFSFVWYWNETYLTSLYIPDALTLPIQLSYFADSFRKIYETTSSSVSNIDVLNEAIYMAGTILSILPLLFMYFVLQRWFVEGIDKAGLTGQ